MELEHNYLKMQVQKKYTLFFILRCLFCIKCWSFKSIPVFFNERYLFRLKTINLYEITAMKTPLLLRCRQIEIVLKVFAPSRHQASAVGVGTTGSCVIFLRLGGIRYPNILYIKKGEK